MEMRRRARREQVQARRTEQLKRLRRGRVVSSWAELDGEQGARGEPVRLEPSKEKVKPSGEQLDARDGMVLVGASGDGAESRANWAEGVAFGTAESKGSLPKWMLWSSVSLLIAIFCGIVLMNRGEDESVESMRSLFEINESLLASSGGVDLLDDRGLAESLDQLEEVVAGFVSAKSVNERIPWCRAVPGLADKMNAHANREGGTWTHGEVERVEQIKMIDKDHVLRLVALAYLQDGGVWELSLIEEGGKLRVDWEAAEAYREQSWSSFLASEAGATGEFRLLAAATNLYFEPFNESDYLAVELSLPRSDDESMVFAYFSKESKLLDERSDFLHTLANLSGRSRQGLRCILKLEKRAQVRDIMLLEIIEVEAESFVRNYRGEENQNSATAKNRRGRD